MAGESSYRIAGHNCNDDLEGGRIFHDLLSGGAAERPTELEEAARLEGSTRWYYFRRVLFPLLMPTTLFVTINAVLNSFKLVDHLFVLTKGGPDNASNLLLYYIFESAFSYFDTNYAATLTVILLVC